MRKNSIRKLIHGILDLLPLFVIPIFAININQKSVEPISIEVQEQYSVDFNQKIENGNFATNDNWFVQGNTSTSITISNNECNFTYITNGTNSGLTYNKYDVFQENHTYYAKCQILSNTTFDCYVGIGQSYVYGQTLIHPNESIQIDYKWKVTTISGNYRYFEIGNRGADNRLYDFTVSNICLFDLTNMGLENVTINEFNSMFPNSYYQYTESQKMLVDKPTPTTYDDTDIGSQFLYSLYISTDNYFNMNNVFNLNGVYSWFEMNIFGGSAPLSIYIVWNIIIYELVMDLLMLLYALFMFFIDACQKLIDKPLESMK